MTLEALYYITQIIAVIAILISLVAIWYQMRQTNSVERSNAQRQMLDGCRTYFSSLSHDRELFEDVRACLHEYDSADDFKKQRFWGWGFDILMMAEQAFYQHREKLINKAQFTGFTNGMIMLINMPGGGQWWREARQLISRDFADFMQASVERDGATLPRWDNIQTNMRLPTTDA